MNWKIFCPTLLLIISGCTNVKDPEFLKIEKFRVKSFGITQGTIGLNVTYHNPNNFGVTIKETEAEVYVNSIHLGTFTQDSLISVEKKADFSIPISGTIPLDKFLQLNLKDLSNKEILIKAEGTTKVGKLGIYITKPVLYEGKHKLNDVRI